MHPISRENGNKELLITTNLGKRFKEKKYDVHRRFNEVKNAEIEFR